VLHHLDPYFLSVREGGGEQTASDDRGVTEHPSRTKEVFE
jgi:hypothetical protein